MFLKRSLSEPAAPRPTRPRLQLNPEEGVGDGEGEIPPYDEEGNWNVYDGGYHLESMHSRQRDAVHDLQSHGEQSEEALQPSGSAGFSYSSSPSSSSVSLGGRYLPRRHHANSYPTVALGSARGRSGYPISPHPYPIPTSTITWVAPQIRVYDSPNVIVGVDDDRSPSISVSPTSPPSSSVSGTSLSDPSSSHTTLAFIAPSTPYSSTLSASGDRHDYDDHSPHGHHRGISIGERSTSRSPIRSQRMSAPLSAPLPYPSLYPYSDEIRQRRKSMSTRSAFTSQSSTPMTPRLSGYYRLPDSNRLPFSTAFEDALTHQRPASRASPPSSSPASPVGGEARLGRRNVFPRHSHRRTSTWGEHWTYVQSSSPSSHASPSPTPSASPHREPVSMQTTLTWQQVEIERRRELASATTIDIDSRGEGDTELASKEKDVEMAQLTSTEKMGWEQTLSLWSTHHPMSGTEVAGIGTEIRQVPNVEAPSITWAQASAGHTGYVASVIDPHLSDSDPYNDSSKAGQDHANVHLQSQTLSSATQRQPSHPPGLHHLPSSSYSTLSGWAGGENSRIRERSNSTLDVHSLRSGVIGEPVTIFSAPSPVFTHESGTSPQWEPRREDSEWSMYSNGTDSTSR
ncbi:hypothetical protein GGU11DRAFT_266924 [Lentinula aff. detonsa]|nr:hypothetical protein GGU11DRAFT_266924 [Lentinula aff. detonsa]